MSEDFITGIQNRFPLATTVEGMSNLFRFFRDNYVQDEYLELKIGMWLKYKEYWDALDENFSDMEQMIIDDLQNQDAESFLPIPTNYILETFLVISEKTRHDIFYLTKNPSAYIDWAVENEDVDGLALLIERGASVETDQLIDVENIEIIKLLLQHGAVPQNEDQQRIRHNLVREQMMPFNQLHINKKGTSKVGGLPSLMVTEIFKKLHPEMSTYELYTLTSAVTESVSKL